MDDLQLIRLSGYYFYRTFYCFSILPRQYRTRTCILRLCRRCSDHLELTAADIITFRFSLLRSQRDSNPYLAPWQGGIVTIQPWDRNCQSFLTVTSTPQVLTRIIVSLVGSVGKVTATSVSKPILWLTAKCSSTDYSHIPHLRLW